MSREHVSETLARARRGGFAVGYFESWNLESLQGVLDAAELTRSPIIIGFNGDFLTRPGRIVSERLEIYAAMAKAACAAAKVACAAIFNECPSDDSVRRAAGMGFDIVMPADPEAPFEQYTQRVAAVARHAHEHGALVEAEIGELPCGASGTVKVNGAEMTDATAAARFIEQTGVDLLAISVGNVHIMVNGQQALDLDRLGAIVRRLPGTPLVLHGGTGIDAESLRAAVKLGVTKVNFGTYVKQRYLAAMRDAYAKSSDNINPHELLGMGGEHDLLVIGRLAVRDAVIERIELLGCAGKG